MKKYISVLFITGIILLTGCKDVEVFYPIPLSTSALFVIKTSGGSYSDTVFIPSDDIIKDVTKKLADSGLERRHLHKVVLEGVAITIKEPSVQNIVVSGDLYIRYGSSQFTGIMKLNNVNLSETEGKPQSDILTPAGVSVLDQALQDIIFTSNVASNIAVRSSGSLAPGTPGDVTFAMLVEFTITTVVKKKQSIFDPLG
ncbi:MAG: hypothetical protein JXL67_14395 [Calditrichaeota bacterium]|nr:hypothetical protein [Calditrichota bacterium]